MSFPDYVTAHWPDPGKPARRLGFAWRLSHDRLSAIRGAIRSIAGIPRLRPTASVAAIRGEGPWSQ
jgi:hypothetical protein